MIEEFDPRLPVGAAAAGLWTKFGPDNVANYSSLNKAAIDTPFGLPWRGSQVVLAYDSAKVPPSEAPKSWAALTAWIAAHPGQFSIYSRPDRGGSGLYFVVRAVHEANGRDPSTFRVDNFTKDEADARFAKAWKLLNDFAPNLYQKGAYTAAAIRLHSNCLLTAARHNGVRLARTKP